jgi:hypothetical protein
MGALLAWQGPEMGHAAQAIGGIAALEALVEPTQFDRLARFHATARGLKAPVD